METTATMQKKKQVEQRQWLLEIISSSSSSPFSRREEEEGGNRLRSVSHSPGIQWIQMYVNTLDIRSSNQGKRATDRLILQPIG